MKHWTALLLVVLTALGARAQDEPAPAKTTRPKSAADVSMLDLFRIEVEDKAAVVMNGLLALEDDPTTAGTLEELMRAAHSIKGAARMVDVPPVVNIAHVMEDAFVAAQKGKLVLGADDTDVLLKAIDMISQIAKLTDAKLQTWPESHASEIDMLVAALGGILSGDGAAVKGAAAGGHQEDRGQRAGAGQTRRRALTSGSRAGKISAGRDGRGQGGGSGQGK